MALDAARLGKFRRRAKFISTQDHLDRAMFQFPPEHHDDIAVQIQPLLRADKNLIARKVDALPELKCKDPENPTLHESTVLRLNNHAAKVADLEAQIADRDAQIENLKKQLTEQSTL